MKLRFRWQVMLGAGLAVLACALYFLHYFLFGQADQTLSYIGKRIAFLPLEVLFITLVVHQLLTRHNRGIIVRKMNMLVGTFFSEMGNELLEQLNTVHQLDDRDKQRFKIGKEWSNQDFENAIQAVTHIEPHLQIDSNVLENLRQLLQPRRQFLLMLLGNPNLLEHEPFSDMLWAVFHLLDELSRRDDLYRLPASDVRHLAWDARRVYNKLVVEWIRYMKHLKQDYPYLFSLEMRINPFDEQRSVLVTG
jgi:hypothetical protein